MLRLTNDKTNGENKWKIKAKGNNETCKRFKEQILATCARSDFKDDKQRRKKKEKNEKIVYVHSTTHVLSLGLCGEKKISHETRNVECLFPKNGKLNINTVRQFEKH